MTLGLVGDATRCRGSSIRALTKPLLGPMEPNGSQMGSPRPVRLTRRSLAPCGCGQGCDTPYIGPMKNALCLFFLVAFTACKKHDKTVQYAATCDLCFVEFQVDNRTLKATTVEGNWRTFVVDTIIIGNQNVFIVTASALLASGPIPLILRVTLHLFSGQGTHTVAASRAFER